MNASEFLVKNDLNYIHTNENLEFLLEGLNPSKEDNILSICGSGDQAFSMMERGAKVLAVDINKIQLKYSQLRLISLFNEDFEDFFILKENPFYNFLLNGSFWKEHYKKMKLSNLIEHKGNVQFLEKDIFDLNINLSKFNKVYLSNSIEHSVFGSLENNFFKNFNSGSMVYCVMHKVFSEPFNKVKIPLLNSGFRKVISFSENSIKDDTWNYFLYEKR